MAASETDTPRAPNLLVRPVRRSAVIACGLGYVAALGLLAAALERTGNFIRGDPTTITLTVGALVPALVLGLVFIGRTSWGLARRGAPPFLIAPGVPLPGSAAVTGFLLVAVGVPGAISNTLTGSYLEFVVGRLSLRDQSWLLPTGLSLLAHVLSCVGGAIVLVGLRRGHGPIARGLAVGAGGMLLLSVIGAWGALTRLQQYVPGWGGPRFLGIAAVLLDALREPLIHATLAVLALVAFARTRAAQHAAAAGSDQATPP